MCLKSPSKHHRIRKRLSFLDKQLNCYHIHTPNNFRCITCFIACGPCEKYVGVLNTEIQMVTRINNISFVSSQDIENHNSYSEFCLGEKFAGKVSTGKGTYTFDRVTSQNR